jgi:hypothetical protein
MLLCSFVCLITLTALQFPLSAQANKGKQGPGPIACDLLPNTDVVRVTGRKSYVEPERISGGFGCGYDAAQLLIYTGDNPEQSWEGTMKTFGHDKAQRFPIAGLGEKAYSFYPRPRNEYEDTNAFVVIKQGRYVIAMSVAAPKGKTAESVQPQAIELAKIVLARLK